MSVSVHQFDGGLHLDHHKAMAMANPLDVLPHPQKLFVPLVGYRHQTLEEDPSALLVKPGDFVVAKQRLTQFRNTGFAQVHAPLAGQVVGITTRSSIKYPNRPMACVEIDVDTDQALSQFPEDIQTEWRAGEHSVEEAIQLLDHMGITGQGGAQFPTAQKLTSAMRGIETLIINGVECEPYLACDEALMRRRPHAIVQGALFLAHWLSAKKILIALEDPLADSLGATAELFAPFLAASPSGVEIDCVTLPQHYPQGAESLLVKTLCGIELPKGHHPMNAGIMVCNVATAASICDACVSGQPLTHRIITVTGPGVRSPRNIYAPIGTPAAELIDRAGGFCDHDNTVLVGGPLSGHRLQDPHSPIEKGSLCLLVTDQPVSSDASAMPCINCGYCIPVCPSRLLPQKLYQLASHDAHQKAAELGLNDCIECGLCVAVCPSQLPLLDWYRYSKNEMRQERLEKEKANQAKRRYEAREHRIQAQQAARELKRKERQERLKAQHSAKSELEAAIARAKEKKGESS